MKLQSQYRGDGILLLLQFEEEAEEEPESGPIGGSLWGHRTHFPLTAVAPPVSHARSTWLPPQRTYHCNAHFYSIVIAI